MTQREGRTESVVEVFVEIPKGSRNKYELDHERHVIVLDRLPSVLLSEIEHFFNVYKLLEPDKKTSTLGYEGVDAAWEEIEAARKRAT